MTRRVLIASCFAALLLAGCAPASRNEPASGAGDPSALPRSEPAQLQGQVPATSPAPADPALLAFPGALGWAAYTRGGRGGRIVRVTTLGPDGAGSLAAALAEPGPRIVVFEVGGVIDLGLRVLEIDEPYLTLAGQTAPAPGITLIKGGLRIATHDVVVQHLRVRPGEAGRAKQSGWEVDGITTGSGAFDVIIDHCSTSWATDENLSVSGGRFGGAAPADWRRATSHRVTVSNNIIAEGLSNSTHAKGEHSKGTLVHDNVSEVAIVGNLFVSNVERNPYFKAGARGVVVNNWIVNAQKQAIRYTLEVSEWGPRRAELGRMSVVGNVFHYGPDTEPGTALLLARGPGPLELHLADNLALDRAGQPVPLLAGDVASVSLLPKPPLWPPGLQAIPASQLVERLRVQVGARPWDRDATDRRLIEQALAGGGRIINSERDVGGYPEQAATHRSFEPEAWDLGTMTPLERQSD